MNTESRTKNATRNILWGYIANIVRIALEFVLRTVFIHKIGNAYLGVNGLYTNILGVLSLSELGIGVSMSYSLYKPIAEGNTEKIKSLMLLFKKAYRIIAVIVAVIGLAVVPFIKFIIRDANGLSDNELIIYYLIFLFNTVTSYCVSYKYTLVNAHQKNYIITKYEMYFKIITIVCQACILFILKSFLAYLICQAVIGVAQKIYLYVYIDKLYPELKEKTVLPLDEEDKRVLKNSVKGTIVHKLGEVAIYQTDNIIISAFINIVTVGLVSNYTLIVNAISTFTNSMFNALTGGYGDFIVRETKERQEELLYVNQFLAFSVFGIITVCLMVLSQPLITLWLGANHRVDDLTVMLIMSNVYFSGQRMVLSNYKFAAGIFIQDRWVVVVRSIVNLALSLLLVYKIGLPGIYIGTLVQGLIGNLFEPAIVYKNMFPKKAKKYYLYEIKYLLLEAVIYIFLRFLTGKIYREETISEFILITLVTVFITIFVYLILFWRNKYFIILRRKAAEMIKRTR